MRAGQPAEYRREVEQGQPDFPFEYLGRQNAASLPVVQEIFQLDGTARLVPDAQVHEERRNDGKARRLDRVFLAL